MKNDDFWKNQFAKHDAIPNTGKPLITPSLPKPSLNPASVGLKGASTTEEPLTSVIAEMLQPVRPAKTTPSFEETVPLVLSRFPAKTKIQWEQWLLNRNAVLVKK
jgi:hypothetical protein